MSPRSRFTLRPLALSASLTCASLLGTLYSTASQADEQTQQRTFDVPAGALASQLNVLAAQSGIFLAGDGALTQGKRSPALQGHYSVEQALALLLEGSGLIAVRKADNRYELQARPDASGTLELGATTISGQGQQESAWGETHGYVARRTSTATKTDTALLETPQSISVVTRERMDAIGAQKLNQALRYTAGVRADSGGEDDASDNPFLRGYAVSFTYKDGLRLRPVGFFGIFSEEIYGLERIEVLKGPTSVLYGLNDPGGMINTISKRPTDYQRGEVAIVGGSGNRQQGNFDISGPLNDDKTLLYRFVALAREADGIFDHTADDRTYIAPSLTWQPNEQTSLTVLGSYQKNKALAATNIPWAAVNGDSPYGRVPMHRFMGEPGFDQESVEAKSLGYEFKHVFDDTWSIKQNVRYSDFDNHEDYLARASGLHNGADGSLNTTISRNYQLRHAYGDLLTLDNQLQARFATGPVEHTALAGVDYSWSNAVRNEKWGVGPELNVFNPVYGQPVDTSVYTSWVNSQQRSKQLGYYVQDQIKYRQLGDDPGRTPGQGFGPDQEPLDRRRAKRPGLVGFHRSGRPGVSVRQRCGAVYQLRRILCPGLRYQLPGPWQQGVRSGNRQAVRGGDPLPAARLGQPGHSIGLRLAQAERSDHRPGKLQLQRPDRRDPL